MLTNKIDIALHEINCLLKNLGLLYIVGFMDKKEIIVNNKYKEFVKISLIKNLFNM
jgi:hypothetical protein